MKIGEYVKIYRREHGLSMQAFGDKCNLSRAYISILEKGINPTTNKPFSPTLETLRKIAEVTDTDLDTLLKMLDDNQTVVVNSSPITLTPPEETHIKKYRQLDDDGKEEIDNMIDFKLKKTETKQKNKSKILTLEPAEPADVIANCVEQIRPRKTGS